MRALALAAVAVLAWPTAARAGGSPLSVRASFSPAVHQFGDAVRARLDLAVDPAQVDPDTVSVSARFGSYAVAGRRLERLSAGPRLVVLRFSYDLRCLTAGCAPAGAQESAAVPPALVRYRLRGGATRAARVGWPPLTVSSRLTPIDRTRPALRAELAPPPPAPRIAPLPLAAGLLATGGLLCLAGLASLGLLLRPRCRLPEVPPLQAALDLVERAAAGSVGERRRALYRLALALERARLDAVAGEARKLAWASTAPAPERMLALVGDVRGPERRAA